MDAQTSLPIQYSPLGILFKKLLHTKLGARIGFMIGISGFNTIEAIHMRDGKVVKKIRSFNSRVDKGGDLTASLLSGTSFNSISSPLPPKYIALSTSSLTPAHTDTTLSGETSNSGVARALGTQGSYTGPASLDAACSYTVTKTFTCGATPTTVVSAALFDAASTGNLFVEANLSSSAAMAAGDTLAITWTINL